MWLLTYLPVKMWPASESHASQVLALDSSIFQHPPPCCSPRFGIPFGNHAKWWGWGGERKCHSWWALTCAQLQLQDMTQDQGATRTTGFIYRGVRKINWEKRKRGRAKGSSICQAEVPSSSMRQRSCSSLTMKAVRSVKTPQLPQTVNWYMEGILHQWVQDCQ